MSLHDDLTACMRLLAFADSAFPVGAFAFSNTLETAAAEGIVSDAASLEAYVADIARQSACTDGIAALHAHRSRLRDDYDGVLEADGAAIRCKLNAELRQMSCRMGKKAAELAVQILPDAMMSRWLADIAGGNTSGTYPVAQGVLFAAAGVAEEALFCAHCYGTVNLILNAALRCVRVSHYDTQRILCRFGRRTAGLYDEIRHLTPDEIHAFTPQTDILAALHEKGSRRMFMN